MHMQNLVEFHQFVLKILSRNKIDNNQGLTNNQLTERDCREWKLSAINPHDRHTWRSGVRSAMCAANKLPGRGPTDVDVAPVPAC